MDYTIFSVSTDVNACDCTRTDTRKRVCTECSLWKKNPLPHWWIDPASAACRSDVPPTELHPHPSVQQQQREVYVSLFFSFLLLLVPACSPSRDGDVAVYVLEINQPSLSTPFHSVLVSVSVFMALSTVFHSIKFSSQLSVFSLCSSGLVSALLVLSTLYLFTKVSLSPDVILCGWLGLKHQLTN